jgi:hypothetical protein
MNKRILSVIVLLVLVLTACSSAKESISPVLDYRESGGIAPAEESMQSYDAPVSSEQGANSFTSTSPVDTERMVLKNANLSIAVDDPTASLERVTRLAEEMGGYVVAANLYQTTLDSGVEVPHASITIRVPAEKLDEALAQIKTETLQPVINETISSQDVTAEYVDLQSRLTNLEAAEQQLQQIMDEATKTEDVINVFNQLTQVREQIEVIKGQIQFYEQSAALSSIQVEIMANAAVQPLSIGGWQPVGVARQALQALINTLQFLFTAGIWIILWLVPVLLVVLLPPVLIVLGILRWRKRRRAKKAVV